MLVFIIKSRK